MFVRLRDRNFLIHSALFRCEAFNGHELLGDRSRTVSGTRTHGELHRTHRSAEAAGDPLLAACPAGDDRVRAGEAQTHLTAINSLIAPRKADGGHDRVGNYSSSQLQISPPFWCHAQQPGVLASTKSWLRQSDPLTNPDNGPLPLMLWSTPQFAGPAGISAPALFWAR